VDYPMQAAEELEEKIKKEDSIRLVPTRDGNHEGTADQVGKVGGNAASLHNPPGSRAGSLTIM
jgi:hypothetical protein